MRSQGDFLSSPVAAWANSPVFLVRIPLLLLACIPARVWLKTLRATNPLWFYALMAGIAARLAVLPSQRLWAAAAGRGATLMQVASLDSVRWLLHIFMPSATTDVAHWTIGTAQFSILISPGCSGMEGLGLVLAFSIASLIYLRRELRFPRALLLVPCALVSIWVLNVLRLGALILIGNTAGPEIAMVGFHSRIGWISFTLVALAFAIVIQRLPWARIPVDAPEGEKVPLPARQPGESPAIRAYLVPFLAIMAASFVSKAASGYFEWLYPLRFVAALLAIYCFRTELKKLDWRFGWLGPLAGVAVFVLWVLPAGAAHFLGGHPFEASHLGPALAALSPGARYGWIAVRALAAVVTVPIAEELAFRGYLTRRLMHREFDEVSFRSLSGFAIAVSSVAFGVLHGQHWLVGILAGLAYAGVLRWRGRMGDAVVAHAVSNLLLAIWVLALGDWSQW